MEQLIRIGSVTDEAANFLKKLVAAKLIFLLVVEQEQERQLS